MEESQYYPCESRWNAVVIVAVILLIGSVVPSPLRSRPDFGRFGPDKFLHFMGHVGLAATLVNALGTERRSERTAAVLAVGSSTAYGIVTNSFQRWIPGRKPERADMVAGFLGSVAGVVAYQHANDTQSLAESHKLYRYGCLGIWVQGVEQRSAGVRTYDS